MKLLLYVCLVSISVQNLLAQDMLNNCPTDEIHQNLLETNPAYKIRLMEYEKNYLKVLEQDKLSSKGKSNPTVFETIPVVFHIMHSSSDDVGQGSNIAADKIIQEVANWNEAFANTGYYEGGPYYTDCGISSSDVQIRFQLASQDPIGFPTNGIQRIPFDGADPLVFDANGPNTGQLDRDMKQLSSWDPIHYLNVWVVEDICRESSGCGIVGYSYLPGLNGAFYDGVVVERNYIGQSSAHSGVMIHELGHFFNLYHTFQGGCAETNCLTGGDRVCDTPPDNSTQFISCNNMATSNSCHNDASIINTPFNSDVQDIYENYMDYSNVSCLNTFTPHQALRMEAVLIPGGGREELPQSQGLENPNITDTQVAFGYGSYSVSENAAIEFGYCENYVDYNCMIKISQHPLQNVNVTVSSAGTAIEQRDFEFLNNSVLFAPTGDLYKFVTLRFYDDALVEGIETIILSLTVSGPAAVSNIQDEMNITIKDNDFTPGIILFEEDFENDLSNWTSTGFGSPNNPFTSGTAANLEGTSAYVSNDGNTYAYDNDVNDFPVLISPEIDGSDVAGAQITFTYKADGSNDDRGAFLYSKDNYNFSLTHYLEGGDSQVRVATFPLSQQLDNSIFKLAFGWNNNGNGSGDNPPLAIDNIQVGTPGVPVATETTLSSAYLGPYETVYFYTSNDFIIAKIHNLSGHDYGCTELEIDRSGIGGISGNGVYSDFLFTPKTYRVIPTSNNISGNYEISIYYTEQEIASWENASGLDRSYLTMIKTSGNVANSSPSNSEVVPANVNTFGPGWAYSAVFNTGFSGFGLSNISTVLPLELILFKVDLLGSKVQLDWECGSQDNFNKFIIERSTDGKKFTKIGEVLYTDFQKRVYREFDYSPENGANYYRLKLVDLDGQYEYSHIKSIHLYRNFHVEIYPTLVGNKGLQLYFEGIKNQEVTLEIVDSQGKIYKKMKQLIPIGDYSSTIDIEGLSSGMYYLKVHTINEFNILKFVLQ